MIRIANVSLSFTGRAILKSQSWQIAPGDRVGLVGNNGSGKTTLMKIMAGLIHPDEGEVICEKGTTFGYLPQDGVVHEGRSLFDETASVFEDVRSMQQEEQDLLVKMSAFPEDSEEHQNLAFRLGEIHDLLRIRDGYQLERTVEKVLVGLGFRHDDLSRACGEFSGGWQMRIALAKVLLQKPTLLLLDEPTNYLDIEARVFLENWLKECGHSVILVSHDRHFLDQVIHRLTDIHDGKLTDYHCNYSRYLVEREIRLDQLRAQAQRVEEERARIQSFIDRFRYKIDKASLVQSRVKMLEKLEKVEIPTVRKKIKFSFPQPERSGKVAISAENLGTGYGTGPYVFQNVKFDLIRGEKVALVGINGAGKTTLMRVLAGRLDARTGQYTVGHNVKIDYFAQDVHKTLDPSASVYDTLARSCPFDLAPQLRNILGAFLFSGDDIEKRTSVLSGGERNRLALARMLLTPSNLLLMDEPTNHLDIEAKDVLLEALQNFEGSVLFVSHDRYFLDNLATKVYALDRGSLMIYPGGYTDFLRDTEAWRNGQNEAASAEESAQQVAVQRQKEISKEERIRRFEQEKQRKREKERLQRLVAKLEENVTNKEEGIKRLVLQMQEPRYATNFSELEKLVSLREVLDKELEKLTREWEEAARNLQSLEDV